MLTILAFQFVLGGGFALSGHKSFDLAIPHQFIYVPVSMARRTYCYIDYSPTAIILVVKKNWPTLIAATTAPWSSHKGKAISAALAASSTPRPLQKATTIAPRPPCKVVSTHVAATIASQPLRKATFAASIATLTSASWPLHKAGIPTTTTAATPVSRSAHKTYSIIFSYSSQMAHAQSGLRKAKRKLRKSSLISRKTTRLNRQDAQLCRLVLVMEHPFLRVDEVERLIQQH
ncbi:hypothetical protein ACLOJK_004184 [Asimina triloba]